MDIAILIIAYLCLGLNSHLGYYSEKGALPYAAGFGVMVLVQWLLFLVNAVYLLGMLWGVLVIVFLRIVAEAITAPTNVVFYLLGRDRIRELYNSLTGKGEQPSPFLLGLWPILLLALAIVTGLDFFFMPYRGSMTRIKAWMNSVPTLTVVIVVSVLAAVLYLLQGLRVVARDYAMPPLQRPHYALNRNVSATIRFVVLWPWLLLIRAWAIHQLHRDEKERDSRL